MLHRNLLVISACLSLNGCLATAPLKDMVGYVPPTSLPAQPKRTLVADQQDQVWTQLLTALESSDFEVSQVDEAKNLLVARYSGNPEPYIDCGSIVTHQNGSLGQIAGSAASVALNYEVEQEPVILNRTLSLDSRIIIELGDQPRGTVISTDTTYVVTKTVDIEDSSGSVREGTRETVSFEAGNRAEFSKGTACQPNGSLDLAVLRSLPNIVGSDEIDRAELSDTTIETAKSETIDGNLVASTPQSPGPEADVSAGPSVSAEDQVNVAAEDSAGLDAATVPQPQPDGTVYDWVLPEEGLPKSALPSPEAGTTVANTSPAASAAGEARDSVSREAGLSREEETQPGSEATRLQEPVADDELAAASPSTIVEDTTNKLLESLNCGGDEWHFCDLVELTTPYRKRNIDQFFGLTINTSESFTSQVVGRDLKIDVLFPSFSSHLHIAYARRDGRIEHIMSSSEVWPADLAHQLAAAGKVIPGPAGLAMIIAVASEEPLFSSPPDGLEEASVYLDRLQQRLTELENENPGGPIAASQLLIYVENAET